MLQVGGVSPLAETEMLFVRDETKGFVRFLSNSLLRSSSHMKTIREIGLDDSIGVSHVPSNPVSVSPALTLFCVITETNHRPQTALMTTFALSLL